MTLPLTDIPTGNILNFNYLSLVISFKILERERERERVTSKHMSYKNILDGLLRLLFSVCIPDAGNSFRKYFPNKYNSSCSGKPFLITDLFCCCRSKSVGTKGLPMAQLYPAAACSDYMLLPFFKKKNN
ncbi:hypothetical protein CLV62_12248 [Dysgonomonas alginatilytica]|uniref:Uncharacterized protein n=1 Tax=Dysgonomonas alginatilytica TaxID=1605892 RepID=A0A2V3PKH7_9BACT|nr:hypothetical protein [Dysgonomonas alginatilytica]PXV62093.1 hypothetical protein CLV62_12248 [Dysgonomonas alginatilytica]